MEIVAYRCVWDGEPGWMQYHDKTDPLPEQWGDDEHPDEVAALVLKIDADIEIERLRGALITGARLLEQGCNVADMVESMRRAAGVPNA